MAISANKIVNVLPQVIKASGNALDLNGLVLTKNKYLPVNNPLSFASVSSVADKFGDGSDEAKAARIYFQGFKNKTVTPASIVFSRYLDEAENASLIGNNLKLSINGLKAVNGNFTITVNGTEQSTQLDFASVNSFDDAVNLINSSLQDVTAQYNPVTKQFKLTASGAEPANTEISHANGNVATVLGLDTNNGLLSIGSGKQTATALFSGITAVNGNWYSFTPIFEASEAEHLDFGAWAGSQGGKYLYVLWTSSDSALVQNSQSTIMAKLKNTPNILPIYTKSQDKAVSILSYFACINFSASNGRAALHGREFESLTPDITSDAQAEVLEANGYNFYGSYSTRTNTGSMWQAGTVTGDFMWADAHAGQAWLNAELEQKLMNLLKSNSVVPYKDEGKVMIESVLVDPLEQFKNFGGCSSGTTLGSDQALEVKNLTGRDVAQALTAKGYVIYTQPFTPTMRANRQSPVCGVLYADGGAFRKITLNSVEVQ